MAKRIQHVYQSADDSSMNRRLPAWQMLLLIVAMIVIKMIVPAASAL